MKETLILARRNLEHVRQIPEKLLDVTLQPLMFVLLFAYVFGGVIAVPNGDYKEYLIGGILVQTLAFGIMGPGVSIASDLKEGMVDRLRSLPIRRSSYLTGHLMAELAAMTVAVAVLCCAGLVVGWRIHSSVPDAIAAFALLELFAFVMLWLGTLAGITARSTDAVSGIVFMTVFSEPPYNQVLSVRFGAPMAGLPLPSAPWQTAQFCRNSALPASALPASTDLPDRLST